jgi:alkylation response protein AidB-like acyl-CoA dehydrogenase
MLSYPQLAWPAEDLPELVRPAIEKYRDEADELRRVPGPLLDQLRAVGAFRLSTPRELGGFELPVAGQPRMTEAGPDVRFCFVPRSSVTVRDTWHVAGMRVRTALEQQPCLQAAVGRAAAQLGAARALLLSAVGVLDAASVAGRPRRPSAEPCAARSPTRPRPHGRS